MVETGQHNSTAKWMVILLVTALLAAGVTFGVTALLVDIFNKQQEARNPFYRVADLDDETVDPAIWGKNFPMQYDQYLKTTDMVRTKFGGSEALPHSPDPYDPRMVVSQSKIELDPRLKRMWAGYAFAMISARSAGTPTCWRIRPSPSGTGNPSSATACSATHPCMWPTKKRAAGT